MAVGKKKEGGVYSCRAPPSELILGTDNGKRRYWHLSRFSLLFIKPAMPAITIAIMVTIISDARPAVCALSHI